MNQVVLFQDRSLYVSAKILSKGLVVYSEIKHDLRRGRCEMEVVVDNTNFYKLLRSKAFSYNKDIVEENYDEILGMLKKKIQTPSALMKLLDNQMLEYAEQTIY